jgi:hypothetical protein
VKEVSTKRIFQNNHMFRISSCSYKFRRIRSATLREPNVILIKLYFCYVMNSKIRIKYTQSSSTGTIELQIYTFSIYSYGVIWEPRALPRLCELYPGICITTEGKVRKTLSNGNSTCITSRHSTIHRRKPVTESGTMSQNT